MWVKKLPREESLKDEPLQSECKEGESQVSLLEAADKVGSEKADEITEKNYLSAESKKGDVKLDANGKPINDKDLEKGK